MPLPKSSKQLHRQLRVDAAIQTELRKLSLLTAESTLSSDDAAFYADVLTGKLQISCRPQIERVQRIQTLLRHAPASAAVRAFMVGAK